MSDASDTKKGIRTFAADFARLKERNADQKVQTKTLVEKATVPKNPKHATATSTAMSKAEPAQTEDIKQIVATKAPVVPPVPTATTIEPRKQIPSFHELQKEPVDTTANKPSVIKKITARNKTATAPSRQVGGGTVITATKKNTRPKHLGLLASLTAWVKSLTKRKGQPPQIAIPETSRRKGVIQSATTKTGTIFTADSETLKERIKERVRQREQADHEPETNWSPYTEPGYPLLEAGDEIVTTPTNVSVAFKQHTKPQPEMVEPEVTERLPDIPEPERTPMEEKDETVETDERWNNAAILVEPQNPIPVPPKPEQPTIPTPPKKVLIPNEAVTTNSNFFTRLLRSLLGSKNSQATGPSKITDPGDYQRPESDATELINEEASIVETQPDKEDVNPPNVEREVVVNTANQNASTSSTGSQMAVLPKSYNAKQLLQTSSTNWLTIVSTTIIVGIVLIVFFGFQVSKYVGEGQSVVSSTQTWLSANQLVTLTIDDSFTAQSLINTGQSGPSGVIEYSLYNTDGAVLPAALALDLVTDNFPITIQQFGTDTRFISIDQSRPQLLMQITDPTSVTGALLAQEAALTQSLVPLFGVAPVGTYMDDTIGSTDVRVLTSTSGQTSLTYGFINDSVFVITGSPEEFITILERTQ